MKITEKRMCLHEDGTPYLQNTKTLYEVDGRLRFDNPEKIYELAKSLGCNRLAEEYVYIACLSSAGRIIGIFEISHGSVNASFLHAREIFQRALMCGAVSVIMWHNHPSGSCTPSDWDKDVTQKVRDAGEIIGIRLLDHLIIGDGYYSFSMQGQL